MTENQQLNQIRIFLSKQPRNRLLLEMLLQTTATVKDILALKVSSLKGLEAGSALPLNSAPGEVPHIFSASMQKYLDKYLEARCPHDHALIFKSNKGGKALTKTSVSRLVRKWIEESGIKCSGLRGLRSLARTHANEMEGSLSVSHKEDITEYALSKVRTMTLQEAVFQELEKAIITGKLLPGQRLTTEKIARVMGVSRIPVREAMARLAQRGFIITLPKKGSVVNELSRDNLKEILDLRLLLESQAVAKAAMNIKEATLEELIDANNEFIEARQQNKADELIVANRKFHMLAYRDSHAPILLEMINQLWDRVSPYYNIMFRQSITTHPRKGVNYHDHLIQALQHRDPQKAILWLEKDLIHSAEFVLELFDLHQGNTLHDG